jgi:hypothetical protein
MKDELTGVPTNGAMRFENRVGFVARAPRELLIKKYLLERYFIDLVAGKSLIKEQAVARCSSLARSADVVVSGEPLLLLPRRYRQEHARFELNRLWETDRKVRGFILNKVRGGFSVAIAGFIAFYPFRRRKRTRSVNRGPVNRGQHGQQGHQGHQGRSEDLKFIIQTIKLKPTKTDIVVI